MAESRLTISTILFDTSNQVTDLDSNQFNRWLTSLANVGVLVGLAVLIVEIRQNNELTMAQIEQSRSESFLEWAQEWVTNDHIAPLRAKMFKLLYENADKPINELGGAERARIGKLVF